MADSGASSGNNEQDVPDVDASTVSQAIHDAVETALRARGGGMITGFAAIIEYFDGEGNKGWLAAHADGQSTPTTMGMLQFHQMLVERDLHSLLDQFELEQEDYDEDDGD